jgi:hypothetical protein
VLRAWLWAPALLATLWWAADVQADVGAEPEPIRLSYTAAEGCPLRDAFLGRLRARTTRFREASEGEAARVFTVALASSGEGSKGRLMVSARDGSSATREVKATTCDQAAAALALVVAVAIDPQALIEIPPAKSEPIPTPPPPVAPPESSRPAETTGDRLHRATRVALGLRWDEMSGITPLLRPVLRPFLEIVDDRPGVFVPALRISFAWTRNAHVALSSGAADFSWYVGRLEACPLRVGSAAASLTWCATFDGGAVRIAGQDAPAITARTRPWVSTGVSARGSARLWRWLFAELELGAAAPWIKDRWVFADGSLLQTPPPVSVWAGAGLGCRFP